MMMNVRATLITWNARLHRLTNQMTAVRTYGRGHVRRMGGKQAWVPVSSQASMGTAA